MNVIALQEVRWQGNGNITILYSDTDSNRHERCISFVVHDNIYRNINNFEAISECICYLHIKDRIFNIIILNFYAPTGDDDDGIKSSFYDR